MKLILIISIMNFKPLFLGKNTFLLFDYSDRIARVISGNDTVDFYIRSDHTTPLQGYILDKKIIFIALRVDTSSRKIMLNPGWWIQIYDFNGIYDTSCLYTPPEIIGKGYNVVKPISIFFKDTIYVTFNISDCVYSFYPTKLKKVKCGYLPKTPKAKKEYGFLPEQYPKNAPSAKKFIIKDNKLYLEVYDGKNKRLVRIR